MPIRARCLAVCLLALPLALSAFASPATAAGEPPIRLEPSPSMQNLTAGETAIFRVGVHNADPLFDHNVAFTRVYDLPENWTYSFNVTSVHVPKGQSANVTLLVNVPSAFASTGTYNFTFRANEHDALGTAISEPAAVLVNVLAPPEPTSTSTQEPAKPARPSLRMFASNVSAAPGDTASTTLTLLNEGSQQLSVELDIVGPASWSPSVDLPFLVIQPGTEPRHVTLRANVPADAANGTTQAFTVQARVDGHTFETPWSVRVLAPAASTSTTEEPSSPTTTTAPTPRATSPTAIGPALRFDFPQDVVQIVSGKTATAQLQLDNIGDTTLSVRMGGTVPDGWAPILFPEDTITLEPRQTRYVQFSIAAPAGIPAGGGGAARVSVTADGGIYREAQFTIRIVEGALDSETLAPTPDPTDEAPAATTSSGDGITVSIPASWGLATGLGAVGAGALVLARRPWREKMLWGAIGLYTRLARPDVLGHEERERLYKLIETQPGTHFHALQRELNWNTGTLTYHIRVLERHGFVVSRRDGLYRRFYLQGAAPRKEVFNDGPTGLRADVLEAIRNQHGMSQTDLSLALGANKQTVNYHVKALERSGHIRVEKRGRETFLYPTTPGADTTERARA